MKYSAVIFFALLVSATQTLANTNNLTTVSPSVSILKAELVDDLDPELQTLSEDEILEIGGNFLKTMTPEQMAAEKRKPPGTPVVVKYHRNDGDPTVVTIILQKE